MEEKEIRSFKKRLELNQNLKQEVINYYLNTKSILKTSKVFKASYKNIEALIIEAVIYNKIEKNNIYDRIKENPNLKDEIITYYLKPSSMNDTVKKFNLGTRGVLKRFLIQFNVPLHSEEIKKQLCEENAKKIFLEKYGITAPLKSPEIQEKCRKTLQEKTGFKYASQVKEFKEKTKQTNLKKYGVENPFQAEIFKEKSKQTCLERYGTLYYQQSQEAKVCRNEFWKSVSNEYKDNIQRKIETTMLERYGVRRYAQTEEFHIKSQYSYICDNNTFDSFPELALWIYAKDHNEEIIRCPCKLPYYFENKLHYYFPDFLYKGKLLEIKGSQFFDKATGKMICPFDKTQDALFEAKHQCMIKNNVIIWGQKQYKFALDYFNINYKNKRENYLINN